MSVPIDGPPDARRPVAVCIPKAGTHLLREVVSALGFVPHGQLARSAEATVPLDPNTAWRIVRSVYTPAEIESLDAGDPETAHTAVDRAVAAFVDAWWIRLGVPSSALARADPAPPDLIARLLARPGVHQFRDTPPGLCWFLHGLRPAQVDQQFLRDWTDTGEPPLLYLYRDPRDVLLSMVTFLSRPEGQWLGRVAEHRVYAGIVRAAGSMAEKLTIALTDPYFPGADAFDAGLWLLRHPRVCAVSFEDLVGPDGGGSRAAQIMALTRLTSHLHCTADLAAVAEKIFNPASPSFHSGRIGGWQEHFTTDHEAMFRDRYGAVAGLYGYQ
jgi:hypothetical protein